MCGTYDPLQQVALMALLGLSDDDPIGEVLSRIMAPVFPGREDLIWDGERFHTARFGLIPHWHTGPVRDFKATTFNARSETAADKPVFRDAWHKGRAIVGAESFFEWDGPPSARRKWRVERADRQPMLLAAIHDHASCAGEEINSFAIVTRPAASDLSVIHDREPVIIEPTQVADWLKGAQPDLTASPRLHLTPLFRDEPGQASLF